MFGLRVAIINNIGQNYSHSNIANNVGLFILCSIWNLIPIMEIIMNIQYIAKIVKYINILYKIFSLDLLLNYNKIST